MGVLARLRDEGKIHHVGLSQVSIDEIERARTVDIATVQNEFNLATRKYEAVLEYCEREAIGFIPVLPAKGRRVRRCRTFEGDCRPRRRNAGADSLRMGAEALAGVGHKPTFLRPATA